jgi:hypothetical protein
VAAQRVASRVVLSSVELVPYLLHKSFKLLKHYIVMSCFCGLLSIESAMLFDVNRCSVIYIYIYIYMYIWVCVCVCVRARARAVFLLSRSGTLKFPHSLKLFITAAFNFVIIASFVKVNISALCRYRIME